MMAMAASPTPTSTSTSTSTKAHNHPPYKQMIVSAIHALKDRKGSSKTAIAKYIEANYKDLPPAHDALLSHHLRRLKKEGVILMIKHSYKLNLEGGGQAMLQTLRSDVPKKRGRPPKNSTSGTGLTQRVEKKKKPGRPKKIPTQEGIGPPTEKKKLGRPPKKASSVEELILPRTMKSMLKVVKRKPGRPKKGSLGFESKVARSIALGEKRKPARPKKGSLPVKSKLEFALSSDEKRKPGRPKKGSLPIKPKLISALSSGERRKRGRPKKGSSTVTPKLDSALSPGEKRKPGRPRKGSSIMKPKLDSAMSVGEKRKLGRPKKGSLPVKLISANVTGGKRKPGRPKKGSDEPMKPKLAVGIASGEKRKRGRPKKDSAAVENNGGKAPLVSLVQCTEEALAVILIPNVVERVLALAKDGNYGGSSSISLPEKPVEGSPMAGATQGVAVSGEKRMRGRPKMKRDGDVIPNSRPSVTKRRGRPPKMGNVVASEETHTG